jgi:pimeloyl-ACP methyl ester carboxylesterase
MLDNPGTIPDSLVEVAGIKTEILSRGRGRPLVFLHPEIGLAPKAPFIDHMAERFRLIAPSLPGYGHTELPRSYSTVDDLAYFTLDLIEAQDLRDVVLVGAGIGGWVAAELATKTTERISHLVLVNAAGIKTGDRLHRDMLDVFALPQEKLEALTYHDTKFARFDPKERSEDEIHVRLRNRESTVLFGWSPYMYNPKLAGRLHRIRIPTLVLWGADDKVAPMAYGRAFAERIPGARFEAIEKAGRFPHVEQPEALARRITEFAESA